MSSLTSRLVRFVFLVHRYMGIAIGLVMAVWCLSGIVMMYVSYPDFPESERIKSLAALDWTTCSALDGAAAPTDDTRIPAFQVEVLDGRCILRLRIADAGSRIINLETGELLDEMTPRRAATVAAAFAAHAGFAGPTPSPTTLTRDQWTVSGDFNRDRPLYRFDFNDPQRTQLYVSSTSGKAVQLTTGSQRFWNWLGAVPHWLYPTVLRQHAAAWSQVVIWISLIGVFLTLTGLYIGIRQYWLGRHRYAISPYRGIMFLHHVPGLIFGVLVLTWVGSGLLSMNPWGALESDNVGPAFERLYGEPPRWRDVRSLLQAIRKDDLPANTVSVSSANLDGHAFAVATTADNERHRYGATGKLTGLSDAEIAAAASRLANSVQKSETALLATAPWLLLTTEDEYHYSHGRDHALLPVVRVTATGNESVNYYLDPLSGKLVNLVDSSARWYRWLHYGLHRLDFESLRSRPLWDIVMVLLLVGASLVSVTGTWIGIRRLTRSSS